jgi:hypothetical protein
MFWLLMLHFRGIKNFIFRENYLKELNNTYIDRLLICMLAGCLFEHSVFYPWFFSILLFNEHNIIYKHVHLQLSSSPQPLPLPDFIYFENFIPLNFFTHIHPHYHCTHSFIDFISLILFCTLRPQKLIEA